ncbi:Retrovirus-related Pol polyprotein from transposon TNT 1-94 [Senna tora]|uniref:Retrovirus-related Pol polyprotein from transposon TNT 1-94 n=1 Tax=Senna tora TaxID=362788 RepID=A0A834TJI4_9FABA|nr:Retrovirus-related Pol polyprotein from transposon TNT 1-94 [Senna tora]
MDIVDKDDQAASSVLATLTNLASNPKFALQSATQPISSKLDDNNYLSWRMLALATIRGHNLYNLLLGESHIPTQFATAQDRGKGTCSDEYMNWQCQDQLLASWLLNSMSDGVVSKMVGCVHSYQVWNKVEELLCSSTRARERQLKNDLRSIKKGSSSMSDFLLKIKKLVDSLGAIGSPISTHDHIESIFDGLDREYESFMTSFSMRKEEYSVTEIEALLLSQEARIEKLKKVVDNVSASMAQRGGSQNTRLPNQFFGQRGGYQGRGNTQMTNGGGPNFFRGNTQGRGHSQQPSQSQNRGGGRQTCFTADSLAQIMNQKQNRPNNGAPVEALIATPDILSDDAWFADSGSSNHLTNNLSNLQVSQPYDGAEQVHIANGSANNQILLKGRNKQGLYVFDNLNFAPTTALPLVSANTASITSPTPSNASSQFRLWHNRLGHPSLQVVKSVLNSCYSTAHKGYKCVDANGRLYFARNVPSPSRNPDTTPTASILPSITTSTPSSDPPTTAYAISPVVPHHPMCELSKGSDDCEP